MLNGPYAIHLHCHETQNEQIDTGGDNGQTEQYKHQTESDISWFTRQSMIILQRDVVTKTNCGQCDEAIVEAIKIIPSLVVGENPSARRYDNGREHPVEYHQISFSGFGLLATQVNFHSSYEYRHEFIQTFTDTLEHNEAKRNSHLIIDKQNKLCKCRIPSSCPRVNNYHCVTHTKCLASNGHWC